jgi:hypothetical protein
MNDELGDRVVYNPRGRNAENDLAACILQAAHVFMMDSRLVWVRGGPLVQVNRDAVAELCRRFIVTAHPVNRGTEAEPDWAVDYRPFAPDELTIRNLIRESLPKHAPAVRPEAAPLPEVVDQRVYDPQTELERAAGRRASAKWAASGSNVRLQQEIEAGQRAAARQRAQGQAGST